LKIQLCSCSYIFKVVLGPPTRYTKKRILKEPIKTLQILRTLTTSTDSTESTTSTDSTNSKTAMAALQTPFQGKTMTTPTTMTTPQSFLFLLEALINTGYDCYYRFLIKAKTEADARRLAQENGGDELYGGDSQHHLPFSRRTKIPYWTDERSASCTNIGVPYTSTADGIIMSSFNAA